MLYVRSLPNFENAAFLYNIATGKSTQITDGMSNVTNPAFDPNGKFLYFTASTDIGPAIDGFGLGSFNRTTTASVYVAVLSKFGTSPIPPQSDDEKDKDKKATTTRTAARKTRRRKTIQRPPRRAMRKTSRRTSPFPRPGSTWRASSSASWRSLFRRVTT